MGAGRATTAGDAGNYPLVQPNIPESTSVKAIVGKSKSQGQTHGDSLCPQESVLLRRQVALCSCQVRAVAGRHRALSGEVAMLVSPPQLLLSGMSTNNQKLPRASGQPGTLAGRTPSLWEERERPG